MDFFCRPPIITSSPSEDHTYSQGGVVRSTNTSDNNSNGTSSDAAYESCEERFVNFFLLLFLERGSICLWESCHGRCGGQASLRGEAGI